MKLVKEIKLNFFIENTNLRKWPKGQGRIIVKPKYRQEPLLSTTFGVVVKIKFTAAGIDLPARTIDILNKYKLIRI